MQNLQSSLMLHIFTSSLSTIYRNEILHLQCFQHTHNHTPKHLEGVSDMCDCHTPVFHRLKTGDSISFSHQEYLNYRLFFGFSTFDTIQNLTYIGLHNLGASNFVLVSSPFFSPFFQFWFYLLKLIYHIFSWPTFSLHLCTVTAIFNTTL